MRIERLVAMANDISQFFAADPDPGEGARSVANHLRRYWDPRMRREIVAHYSAGGEGLQALARAGVALLVEEPISPLS
jgi:formate dehydrogenase subunit delta